MAKLATGFELGNKLKANGMQQVAQPFLSRLPII